MSTLREAADQALDALESMTLVPDQSPVITALRAALHEPGQEPQDLLHKHEWFRTLAMKPGQYRCLSCGEWAQEKSRNNHEWQPLTAGEIGAISDSIERSDFFDAVIPFARAVEQALKEKNT